MSKVFHRKMNKGGGAASGPAIMMMPPHIRATFMPNPPLKHLPPPSRKSKRKENPNGSYLPPLPSTMTGVQQLLSQFERSKPPKKRQGVTPSMAKTARRKRRAKENADKLREVIESYKSSQKECGGEFEGMNCYNTLFIGRLAYETSERKLLREMEVFGPIKDLKLISDKRSNKSRGYAFIEYEHEEDMKRAYRAADGMKIDGREIVVDVERGHTVPAWLPRRLGGGLGGTRLGGAAQNITAPGRFDPSKPNMAPPPPMPPMPYPPQMDHRRPMPPVRGPPPYGYNGPPPPMERYGGPPPPHGHPPHRYNAPPPPGTWDRRMEGHYRPGPFKRPRSRSPSPPRQRDRRDR